MARTQIKSPQIADAEVKRADLNTATSGSAVISKVIADTGLSLASTGADSGTGDVTISLVNSVAVSTKTSNYTATNTDDVLLCNSSGGAFTITLPSSPTTGKRLTIKKIGTTSNMVSVAGNGKTIDGYTSFNTTVLNSTLTIRYNGTSWYVESAYGTFAATDNDSTNQSVQTASTGSKYLSIADNSSLSFGDVDFSIAGWVYMDSTATWMMPFGKWEWGLARREYGIYYDNSVTKLSFWVSSNGTASSNVYPSTTLATSTWQFVVGVHDSVNNLIKISINGGTFATSSYSAGCNDNSSALTVGASLNSGSPAEMWNGRVDSFGIWNKALSQDEVTSLYNSGNGAKYSQLSGSLLTNLISYYDFGAGAITTDSAGSNTLTNNNSCTNANGVTS